jgi:hypothetical protein
MKSLENLTGKQFGRWTVLSLHPERQGRSRSEKEKKLAAALIALLAANRGAAP